MKNTVLILTGTLAFGALPVLLSACGGAPVREVKVEAPTYKVIDAAPGGEEAWLDNPTEWAKKEGKNTKKYYYYTGDAQSANKRMACQKAHADAMDDISRQVSSFVDTSLARAQSDSTSSDSNGTSDVSATQTETSSISSQLTKALVTGVKKQKQYWEQRDYSSTGGAKSIYHCWVLAKVSKQKVKSLISRAETLRLQKDPDLKSKVEGKLANIEKDYDAYMEGHPAPTEKAGGDEGGEE